MVNPPDPIFPPTNTLNSNALSRHGRHERDVLRFGVGAVIEASGDRDVQFARKVRKLGVAVGSDQPLIDAAAGARKNSGTHSNPLGIRMRSMQLPRRADARKDADPFEGPSPPWSEPPSCAPWSGLTTLDPEEGDPHQVEMVGG